MHRDHLDDEFAGAPLCESLSLDVHLRKREGAPTKLSYEQPELLYTSSDEASVGSFLPSKSFFSLAAILYLILGSLKFIASLLAFFVNVTIRLFIDCTRAVDTQRSEGFSEGSQISSDSAFSTELKSALMSFKNQGNKDDLREIMAQVVMNVHHNLEAEEVNIIVECLELLSSVPQSVIPRNEMKAFFENLSKSIGRTALCISGGANLSLCHLGVVKTLLEMDQMPEVISGSSGGAIVASVLGTKTKKDAIEALSPENCLLEFFKPISERVGFPEVLSLLLSRGSIYSIDNLAKVVRSVVGDVTFIEAYKISNLVLNITVSPTSDLDAPRLFNYLSSPDIIVWSAVAASCSLPFVFKPYSVIEKNSEGEFIPWSVPGVSWIDGSVYSDLPLGLVSEMFNVNNFIVSQVNPHILPFINPPTFNRVQKALNVVRSIIYTEFKYKIKQFIDARIFPKLFLAIDRILQQRHQADINIIPKLSFRDYFHLVGNINKETLDRYCLAGKEAVKPVIDSISVRLKIERKIHAVLETFQEDDP